MTATFYRLFAIVFLLFSLPAFAQQAPPAKHCATQEADKLLQEKSPEYAVRKQLLEKEVAAYLKRQPAQRTEATTVIPVVFHVVYNSLQENISDAQLQSQIAVLNEDFNRQNKDTANTPAPFKPLAGNPKINFCLAILDPAGQPTTGITRTQTNAAAFTYVENRMKFDSTSGKSAWNPDLYLNIWICNIKGDNGEQVIGYAQFPGGPRATDGVVIHYRNIGRFPYNRFPSAYNLGRTATHEIGHWLGLQHIWGEDESCDLNNDDNIADTPLQAGPNDQPTCPTFPKISCNNGPNGDMFMNFMDYSNDACMNLFTRGQANRMNAVLQTFRSSIISSNVCNNVINADFRAEPDAINPGETTDFYYYSNGRWPDTFLWTFEGATPSTSTEINPKGIRYDNPGAYTVTLTVSDESGSDTETKIRYLKVTNQELQLYPNPASDRIQVGAPAGFKLQTVEIFNTAGQLMLRETAEERTLEVNIRGLKNGLYIIRGTTDNDNSFSKRLLIIR